MNCKRCGQSLAGPDAAKAVEEIIARGFPGLLLFGICRACAEQDEATRQAIARNFDTP